MFGDSGCHVGPSLQLLPHPPALIVGQTHLEPRPSHRLPLQRHSTSSRGLAQQLLPVEQTAPCQQNTSHLELDIRLGRTDGKKKNNSTSQQMPQMLFIATFM